MTVIVLDPRAGVNAECSDELGHGLRGSLSHGLRGSEERQADPLTAWLVHIYTALGAVAALLGARAVIDHDVREAFLWMMAATLIDSTDGWLARLARVRERTPRFDGARLDDIVDYLTFVFLPMLLVVEMDLLPEALEVPVSAAVLLASAYGFASTDAKTDDYFFTGFPSYWNIVALYIVALGTGPTANALILLAFAALVFVRTGYVYPSRTPILRGMTIALGAAWALMTGLIVWQLPAPSRPIVLFSLFFPLYYFALSFYLHLRKGSPRGTPVHEAPARHEAPTRHEAPGPHEARDE